eukprot:159683-Pelagomonas_calceolata.AAC.1
MQCFIRTYSDTSAYSSDILRVFCLYHHLDVDQPQLYRYIMGEVKEHVFWKTIRRMHNQGSFSRKSASLVIGQAFTVALSR